MTYRPRLEQPVLRQVPGLPDDAFDLLVRTLARICDDPYDRLFSLPTGKDPRERMGELGDSGFIVFSVDDDAELVRVYGMVWNRLTLDAGPAPQYETAQDWFAAHSWRRDEK